MRLEEYIDEQGKSAFASWFNKLTPQAAVKVTTYLTRVEIGNFSQLKGIGSGVHELRIDWGSGYRVYMGRDGDTLIILLGGGTKKRQQDDIEQAKERWKAYKKRKKGL
ncbi:MAG: type II toxin-antitoxin system RelE/ParE family toxin [Symploca sp. SIO3C6]|nr:type II toxin-antitoxin system RelE/ParE family toxin [Symploca sp. SIO3C6]